MMTTRMIFVRHGESEGNLQTRFIGQGNVPLTDKGHTQAEAAAKHLQTETIDAFYSSDLIRAYDTACHIARYHQKPVAKSRELREIFAGAWEGVSYDELGVRYPNEYPLWQSDIGRARCTEGESTAEVYERINRFVDALAKAHAGQTVLCATHATPIRALMCRWHGVLPEDMKNIPWTKNASVTTVDYHEDGSVTVIEEGDTSFMAEEWVTGLPENV